MYWKFVVELGEAGPFNSFLLLFIKRALSLSRRPLVMYTGCYMRSTSCYNPQTLIEHSSSEYQSPSTA